MYNNVTSLLINTNMATTQQPKNHRHFKFKIQNKKKSKRFQNKPKKKKKKKTHKNNYNSQQEKWMNKQTNQVLKYTKRESENINDCFTCKS